MIVQLSEIRRGDLVRMPDRSVLTVTSVSTSPHRVIVRGSDIAGRMGRVTNLPDYWVELEGRIA